MNISTKKDGAVLTLEFQGRLDGSNSAQVEQELVSHIAAGERKLLMNLAGLEYVSSAGLRVFLIVAKNLKKSQGGFALCGMNEQIREIFEISGFLDLMPHYPDRPEALKSLG